MPTIEEMFGQQNAIIRHLMDQQKGLQRAFEAGIIQTGAALRESLEKNERGLRLNQEFMENMRRLTVSEGGTYSTQVPGKREPYWLNKSIILQAGSAARVTASEPTSSTGPFEVAQIMCVARASIPIGVTGGVIVRETRFRSVSSVMVEPMAAPSPTALAAPSYEPDTTYQYVVDFLFEYQTGKANRRRMNAPIPSSFLFTEQGRPAYLACGDILAPADSIGYAIEPLFPSRGWLGGVNPGAITDPAQPVAIDVCMHGILFAQAPDFRP
jgi:hypothetical protein